ncbi:MAG: beta-propeller fold lactonase family protein [Myxococcota bacterium]
MGLHYRFLPMIALLSACGGGSTVDATVFDSDVEIPGASADTTPPASENQNVHDVNTNNSNSNTNNTNSNTNTNSNDTANTNTNTADPPVEFEEYVFVGTSTGLHRFRLERSDNSLTVLGVVEEGSRYDAVDVNPEERVLYVSQPGNDSVTAFAIGEDAELTEIATTALGFRPVYIALDATRTTLLSASFGGNAVGSFAITDDFSVVEGSLGTPPTGARPHAIITDPNNQFAFVPCRDSFDSYQYVLNPDGSLTANAVAKADGPVGGGPRHIEFQPTLNVVYVNNEMGDSISRYSYDPTQGRMSFVDTRPTLPDGADPGNNTTADVALTPDGAFLYVSNRGDESIARYSIDETTGALTPLGHTSCPARPRSIDIDALGAYLAVSGQDDDRTELYAIGVDGDLTSVEQVSTAEAPTWVEFVRLPLSR